MLLVPNRYKDNEWTTATAILEQYQWDFHDPLCMCTYKRGNSTISTCSESNPSRQSLHVRSLLQLTKQRALSDTCHTSLRGSQGARPCMCKMLDIRSKAS
jgi:hypothetical protein